MNSTTGSENSFTVFWDIGIVKNRCPIFYELYHSTNKKYFYQKYVAQRWKKVLLPLATLVMNVSGALNIRDRSRKLALEKNRMLGGPMHPHLHKQTGSNFY